MDGNIVDSLVDNLGLGDMLHPSQQDGSCRGDTAAPGFTAFLQSVSFNLPVSDCMCVRFLFGPL